MKYIMIMEDGTIFKSDTITRDDKDACDNGILDVIDTDTMQQYYEDIWVDITVWGG